MRRHKYGVRTDKKGVDDRTVDNVVFASKAEANRYRELKASQNVGLIHNLELQPKYPLYVKDKKVGTYIADFRYQDRSGGLVIEDVKGVKTAVYRLKKKIFEAYYGVPITEVT